VQFAEEKKPYIHATLENTKPDTAVHSRELIEGIIKSPHTFSGKQNDSKCHRG
jgi:hypothetical protein